MQFNEPRARIGDRSTAVSRVKQLALKSLVVAGGVVMLASAFVLSFAVVAIGLVLVLTVGGYVWWQTRDLRKQIRAQMQMQAQAQSQPRSTGRIIEGEVISPEQPRR